MHMFNCTSFLSLFILSGCLGEVEIPPYNPSVTDDGGFDSGVTDDGGIDSGGSTTSPDVDNDGWGIDDGDCDDTNADINPDASEVCNGIDDDCDDLVDDDDPGWDASSGQVVYLDNDEDGYGDENSATAVCEPHKGSVDQGGDCDDTNADISPEATEVWYDGVDQNCDDLSDYDADLDGYDREDDGGEDCDDADAEINPSASETWYDGIDQNCDDLSDYDADLDSFDSESFGGEDCDDTNADISPEATEVWYDGVDQNCDDLSDYDADLDGYDREDDGGEDCDDADAEINPSASETWYDGIDQNCDDLSDYDADLDSFDSESFGGEDCDDAVAMVNPDAEPNPYAAWDQDCDGVWDRAGETFETDGDGFFTFDSDAENLFSDEEGDSTFVGGVSNWTVYYSEAGLSEPPVVEYAFDTYPSTDAYMAMELLQVTSPSSFEMESLISSSFLVEEGRSYAFCGVVKNPNEDGGESFRVYLASQYDAYLDGESANDYPVGEYINAGEEPFLCGGWTSTFTGSEELVVVSGHWDSVEPGLFTHFAVGTGTFE